MGYERNTILQRAARTTSLGASVLAVAMLLLIFPATEASAAWGITVGIGPLDVAVDSETGYSYVVSADRTLTTVGPGPGYPVTNSVVLGHNPRDVAVSAVFDKVYVTLPGAHSVAVADTVGNLLGEIDMGRRTRPTFSAIDDTRGRLYVANRQEKAIAVVGMATDSILARYPTGIVADGFGLHPGLNRVFVSNRASGTVTAFDGDTGAQVGQATIGEEVSDLFVDVERDKIYAALPLSSRFAVLDAATLVVGNYAVTPSPPSGFGVDYSNDRLLVSYSGSSAVGIWDAVSISEVTRATVGPDPAGLDVVQGQSTALVTNSGSDYVSIIDTVTGSSLGVVQTLDRPASILLSPIIDRIYVGHYQIDPADPVSLDAPLEVFSLGTGNAVGSIAGIGNVFPWGMAEKPAASRLYVSRTYAGTVAVVDTSTNSVVGEIPVGGLPRALLFDATSGNLYVSGMFTSDLVVIDTATNSVISRIPVGSESAGLALNASAGVVYVAVESTGEVKAVATSNGAVLGSQAVGGSPLGVSYSPGSNRVYVANFALGELQVLDANTLTLVTSVPFGVPVHTVRSGGGKISVASWEGMTNYQLDEATLGVVRQTPFDSPIDFALDPAAGYLYQLSFGSNTINRVSMA